MRTEQTFILELLIDAGFVSQLNHAVFQVKTAFGAFKTGDIIYGAFSIEPKLNEQKSFPVKKNSR